jgi:tRNA(fMet)-specific endonuclease VapC
MNYLLDTNIISALMKEPQGKVARRISQAGERNVFTSIIVVAEVKYGIWKSQSQRLAAQFERIADGLAVNPFVPPADEHYAVIRTASERKGLTVSQNDLLIAAQSVAIGATLVSDDRIFLEIPGLKVENWLRDAPADRE